jgi:hypothetical protein
MYGLCVRWLPGAEVLRESLGKVRTNNFRGLLIFPLVTPDVYRMMCDMGGNTMTIEQAIAELRRLHAHDPKALAIIARLEARLK